MAQHFGGALYSMSFIKYRVKEVAADFGITPKEVSEIIGKFGEKPKSNTQVLTDSELNVVFDYMTQKNQIKSIEQVFAVKPAAPKAEPKPAAAPAQNQQQGRPQGQNQNRPQGQQQGRPQNQNNQGRPQNNNQGRPQNNNGSDAERSCHPHAAAHRRTLHPAGESRRFGAARTENR